MMMSQLIFLAEQNEKQLREHATFVPTVGSEEELVEATLVAALHDNSPVGEAVLAAARSRLEFLRRTQGQTVEADIVIEREVLNRNNKVREGSIESVEKWVRGFGGMIHNHLRQIVTQTQRRGGVAIVVASAKVDLGVICFRSKITS